MQQEIPLHKRLKELEENELLLATNDLPSSKRLNSKSLKNSKSSGNEDVDQLPLLKKKKNAPTIMRSDRPVKKMRLVNKNEPKFKPIDPRFSDLNGALNYDKFLKSFDFLQEQQEKEVKFLEKKIKKAKNETVKDDLKLNRNKLNQDIIERNRYINLKSKLTEIKQDEKEKVKSGKKPYFLKPSAKKQIALDLSYEELKKSGKLKQFLHKKRRKNSNKDHKKIPTRRGISDE